MVRKPPSTTDTALIEHARRHGVTLTATQLERWRRAGLLPANVRRSLGRGRGRASTAAAGAAELAVWLGRHAGRGRRPHDLALLAFGDGLAVPEATVRAALRATLQSPLPAEAELAAPTDSERAEWAWTVAARAAADAAPTLLPRRMRRIDARITAAGISFAPPEVAAYDQGPVSAEPMTGRDLAEFSIAAVLAGGAELAGPALAARIRPLLPSGAASPVASWLEYPDGPGRDPSEITDGAGLTLLPAGDARVDLLREIDTAPLERLRAAWYAAAAMRQWALGLCSAVERELDHGQLGAAAQEWMLGTALGLSRLLLRDALRTRTSTAGQAATAVMLLGIGAGLRRLRTLVPDAQFDLLPVILPPFLHPLADIDPPAPAAGTFEGMSLREDLCSSARRWVATALQAYANDPPDHDFAVHHMAVAVEHMSKAYLCSISEVLLVANRPTVDDLLLLAGRDDKTSRQRFDLKTIGGAEAIARAEQVFGKRLPDSDALQRLREVRNGITHLGRSDDPAKARALLAAGIGYINELLGELDEDPGAFWDAYRPLTTDLVMQAVTETELRYQHKLRRARQIFEQRFGSVKNEAARAAQIEALAAVPVLSRWYMISAVTCPACGSPAMVSGRDYSEDFGTWFAPRYFGCRVCELRLEGDELKLAGFENQFLDEHDEEEYRDWKPDDGDLHRLAAAKDEYDPESYDDPG